MKRIAINGMFVDQDLSGVQRNAYCILRELDKLESATDYIIVIPEECRSALSLNNIEVIKYGSHKGRFWEQIDFYRYCKLNKMKPLSLCNTAPLLHPGIVIICDVIFRRRNDVPQDNKGFLRTIWRRLQNYIYCRKSARILTISEFSKREIKNYYPFAKGVDVIPCAWQHFKTIELDEKAFEKTGLKNRNYFFSLSNIATHKNLNWIISTARINPNDLFVVAGGVNPQHFNATIDDSVLENLIYVGRVSDELAKTIMANAKAFLSPSFYEGFNIPPMESLSVGTPVIISDISVHHEIYENAAYYIDPYKPLAEINKIVLNDNLENASRVLSKYSWVSSAQTLDSIVHEVVNMNAQANIGD